MISTGVMRVEGTEVIEDWKRTSTFVHLIMR